MQSFAQRWLEAAQRKGAPVCVGLDPVWSKLPPDVRQGVAVDDRDAVADAMTRFCSGVIDAVHDAVPAVKPQLACFERYGASGYAAYERVTRAAKDAGLLVIADAKRGDIGISAEDVYKRQDRFLAAGMFGPETGDGNDFVNAVITLWQQALLAIPAAYAVSFYFCASVQTYLLVRQSADGSGLDDAYDPTAPKNTHAVLAPEVEPQPAGDGDAA